MLPEILEVVMVVSFGISWPLSIIKSYRARTTKGKSIIFLCFILLGYACGIASKIASHNITYVIFFYIINFVMVFIDAMIYFRNRRIDKEQVKE